MNYQVLAPGPVPIPDSVVSALTEAVLHHRTPEFQNILKSVLLRLKQIFATDQPVFIHSATGSGAMESAIVNLFCPGDQLLIVDSGKFGERWVKMAQKFGLNIVPLSIPWGDSVEVEQIQTLLQHNPKVKAVLTQACETSTGAWHPVQEIGKYLHDHHPSLLFVVDAITALGATDLQMDRDHIDALIGGSQKAFMMPTGLAFISLSEKAWRAQKTASLPRYYFDLAAEFKANQKNATRFSSPVHLIRALDQSLNIMLEIGSERILERTQRLSQSTRYFLTGLGFTVFPKSASPSLSVVTVPKGVDGRILRRKLEQDYHVTVMGGQDQLEGQVLRIGHLGWIKNKDMKVLFESIGELLKNTAEYQAPDALDYSSHLAMSLNQLGDEPNEYSRY